ncbi:nucleolar GTP-binding protein 1-like [Lycorma delicatula]|uniref:nucleolar GTP-binding protein 1-like n=1 Tax=Lycorma delicatula TaxID=130591 RepID=UPI003F510B2A
MNLYNFKNITVVLNVKDLCDVILSKTQRKTPTVIHKQCKIYRIRSFYLRKVKTSAQNFTDYLSKIIQEFPKIDNIHPFYSSLLNIYYDKDHYKIALGQINLARNLIHNINKEYSRLMKFGDSLYRCKQLKRIALGRMVTVIKKQSNTFQYLEQVRQHLSRLPSINPYTRSIIICGFPNVGKSSFLNKLTRANVDIQPYPFTTKSLYVGHMDFKYLRWQLIDTPGIFDHKLEDRNVIEMQSITALAHLNSAVLFFIDISEDCGYSIEDQVSLFTNIKPLFVSKPIIIVCNKIDLIQQNELNKKHNYLMENLCEDNDRLPILMMSTMDGSGIEQVKEIVCDSLLAHRIINKINNNKYNHNRLYVANPNMKDEIRKPTLPSRDNENQKRGKKRKLEKDIEIEAGDNYTLDLKKHYDLPDEYKYDIIPEIWEGHNIMDFVQPNVLEEFKKLNDEEKLRERSGWYDAPTTEINESMKEIKELAKKIRDRKAINKLESISKKKLKSKLSRTSTPLVRSRSLMKFKDDMANLGIAIDENSTYSTSKKYLYTRKRSKPFSDKKLCSNKIARISVKKWPKYNKFSCESDRFIGTKKPKHLYCGKRGVGKTTRR